MGSDLPCWNDTLNYAFLTDQEEEFGGFASGSAHRGSSPLPAAKE